MSASHGRFCPREAPARHESKCEKANRLPDADPPKLEAEMNADTPEALSGLRPSRAISKPIHYIYFEIDAL